MVNFFRHNKLVPSLHTTSLEQSKNISDSTFEGLEHAILNLETERKVRFKKASAKVEKLTKLKASRMKELVMKKRSELEEICRKTHIEPDSNTTVDKSNVMIDSGLVDPGELLKIQGCSSVEMLAVGNTSVLHFCLYHGTSWSSLEWKLHRLSLITGAAWMVTIILPYVCALDQLLRLF